MFMIFCVLLFWQYMSQVHGWTTRCTSAKRPISSLVPFRFEARSNKVGLCGYCRLSVTRMNAKRNKRQQSRQDEDDLNHWYDSVDENASPDDIFWEEMERQRLLAKLGGGGETCSPPNGNNNNNSPLESTTRNNAMMMMMMMNNYGGGGANGSGSGSVSSSSPSLAKTNSLIQMASMNGQTPKSAEATLSEYSAYMCNDNWLDEELLWMMTSDDKLYHGEDDDNDHGGTRNNVKSLDEQLDQWEALEDSDDFNTQKNIQDDDDDDEDDEDEDDNIWMQSDEPWDHLWNEQQNISPPLDSPTRNMEFPSRADRFLFHPEEVDDEMMQQMEQETLLKLSQLTLKSARLDRARSSPKAKLYFQRKPNSLEGYDRMWVSAIDNVCFKNLVGPLGNYGIQFADNFGDFQDGSLADGMADIEDIASFKARQVYNVTGLPCIASRTSFEIEPIPINLHRGNALGRGPIVANPRVTSGYKFNDIGMHVDYICDALRPLSEPSRVTRFKTCLCFYDGKMELFDYGICDVDLYFANSLRTFIPMSQAIHEMTQKLILTFGLEYQKWLTSRVVAVVPNELGAGAAAAATSSPVGAVVKLRDRVLKEGKVFTNDIIDVSAFMDSQVDVNLMDDCAKELSSRFMKERPSKILTVATTGLVVALPMAKYLQVPVVYARKERSVVMSDTYKAGYKSKTVGANRELWISKNHLDMDDRVLIVDDFLSGGSSQEALLRIVLESGATPVGIAVLLEKVFDSGRQSLSGFNLPIQSLCRIYSVQDGVIQLEEEEGFDRMRISKTATANSTLQDAL